MPVNFHKMLPLSEVHAWAEGNATCVTLHSPSATTSKCSDMQRPCWDGIFRPWILHHYHNLTALTSPVSSAECGVAQVGAWKSRAVPLEWSLTKHRVKAWKKIVLVWVCVTREWHSICMTNTWDFWKTTGILIIAFPWDPKEQYFNTVSPRISAVAQDSQLDSMIRNTGAHLLSGDQHHCSCVQHVPEGPASHDAWDHQAKSRGMVNILIHQPPLSRCILIALLGFSDRATLLASIAC